LRAFAPRFVVKLLKNARQHTAAQIVGKARASPLLAFIFFRFVVAFASKREYRPTADDDSFVIHITKLYF
jgi:hypothetical protein